MSRLDAVREAVLHPAGEEFPAGPHDTRSALMIGRLLGIAVSVAFVTGIISHLHQNPIGWLDLPSRPVRAYQISQGLHVISGIACLPLLLAKLWVVFGRLFVWPPVRDLTHGLERALLAPLVAGMVFQVVSGLLNVAQWYPWPFFFPRVHYAVAWIVIGSLVAHLAFKAHHIWGAGSGGEAVSGATITSSDGADGAPNTDGTRATRGAGSSPGTDGARTGGAPDADRRALLLGAVGSVAVVTLATAGQTVPLLRAISVLAPRDIADGAQGLAVNRTADVAKIRSAATDPAWQLTVAGERPVTFTLADLAALPQQTVRLPIACVEGWSFSADWTGVPLRALLEAAGTPSDAHLRAVSLEQDWLYARSPLNPGQAWDPLTLLALRVNGQTLHIDHGYPVRLIGPNRPGVQQTKWLSKIELA